MADSITELSNKRGLDIRDYALIVGGGAGAVHGAAIADNLHISTVVIPRYSGLYSAFGMFANDIGRAYVRTYIAPIPEVDVSRLNRLYQEMEQQAFEELRLSDIAAEEVVLKRSIDVRYAGQFHELEVDLPDVPSDSADIQRLTQAFADRHRALYGFDLPFRPLELVFVRLRATVTRRPFELPSVKIGASDPQAAFKRTRQCFFGGAWVETPSYDAERLQAGNRIQGPALIEEQTTTVVIPAQFVCDVDPARAYVLRKEA
jgi:N-methylhydantoinase A